MKFNQMMTKRVIVFVVVVFLIVPLDRVVSSAVTHMWDLLAFYRGHANILRRNFFLPSVRVVFRQALATLLITSAWVGYAWMVPVIVLKPSPPFMARVNSLIMSPAWTATIVAPTMWSVPLFTWTLANPSSSPSSIARSTSSSLTVNVSISIPFSLAPVSYIST